MPAVVARRGSSALTGLSRRCLDSLPSVRVVTLGGGSVPVVLVCRAKELAGVPRRPGRQSRRGAVMSPRYRSGAGKRVDNTAKPLIAYALSIGFEYEVVNGTFDGVLAWGSHAVCVTWKSAGGQLTPAQQRMVARGFPVRFLSRPEQLDALRAELLRVV